MTVSIMQQPSEKKIDGRAKPRKFHVDREWFERVYLVERLETRHIAAQIGCCQVHVTEIAKKFGIKPRGKLRRTAPWPTLELDVDEIVRLYVEERMATDKIGEIMGCTTKPILARLRERGVQIRHHNDTKRGAKAKNRIELDIDLVLSMYAIKYQNPQTISKHFGVCPGVIARILKETGTPTKPMSESRDMWGGNAPNWKPSLTDEERENRRDQYQQKVWRLSVYERDAYTCQKCGNDKGGNLNAHHIVPHSKDKSIAWDIDNGVTLCKPCHMGFHGQYGYTQCTRADLEKFLA